MAIELGQDDGLGVALDGECHGRHLDTASLQGQHVPAESGHAEMSRTNQGDAMEWLAIECDLHGKPVELTHHDLARTAQPQIEAHVAAFAGLQ